MRCWCRSAARLLGAAAGGGGRLAATSRMRRWRRCGASWPPGATPAVLLNLKGRNGSAVLQLPHARRIRLSLAGFAAIVVLLGITLRSGRARRAGADAAGARRRGGRRAPGGRRRGPDDPAPHRPAADRRGTASTTPCSSIAAAWRARPRQCRSRSCRCSWLTSRPCFAFGVAGLLRVPVLSDLGATVAPGAALALLFCALLSHGRRRPPLIAGRLA